MVYINAPRWETARVFYSVTLHTFYICFSFRYLEKTASGATTPLFFLAPAAFINNCVKFWLNIAVALDKRRIIY